VLKCMRAGDRRSSPNATHYTCAGGRAFELPARRSSTPLRACLSLSSSQAPPLPPPPQQQQQQQQHYALLFCPNTDTGPEAGNKLARTQAHTADPGVGCCAPVSVTSPLFIALAQRAPPARPGPGILWPRPQGKIALAHPRPQEIPARPCKSNTNPEPGQRPGALS
jgi:hypothetical protein